MSLLVQLLNIIFLLSLSWWISLRVKQPVRKIYWAALLFKVVGGIALGWLYFYYYVQVGDTIWFHLDAQKLADIARTDFFEYLKILGRSTVPSEMSLAIVDARSFFFSKIVSLFMLFTENNYWITSCYFSLLSFFSSWFLFRTINQFFKQIAVASAVAFLFVPSVVFWSSGIIKESIAISSLFFLTSVFLRFWFARKVDPFHLAVAVLAFMLLWLLKYHYGAIFIAVASAMMLYDFVERKLGIQNFIARTGAWIFVTAGPLFLVTFIHPNFNIKAFLDIVCHNHQAFVLLSAKEDLIHFYQLEPTVISIVINAPLALFSGLLRPLAWEAGNSLQLVAGIENLLLFLLLLSTLWRWKGIRVEHAAVFFGIVTFVALLSVFITLSTPNFGTLSRYRVGYEPFFVCMVLSYSPLTQMLERKFGALFMNS